MVAAEPDAPADPVALSVVEPDPAAPALPLGLAPEPDVEPVEELEPAPEPVVVPLPGFPELLPVPAEPFGVVPELLVEPAEPPPVVEELAFEDTSWLVVVELDVPFVSLDVAADPSLELPLVPAASSGSESVVVCRLVDTMGALVPMPLPWVATLTTAA